jgi:phosphatidate phosphatase APP1
MALQGVTVTLTSTSTATVTATTDANGNYTLLESLTPPTRLRPV